MIKILKSALMIVAVGAIATSATGAYFSDSESVVGNTFAAGSIDLQIGEGATLPISAPNLAPGQSSQGKITLTNAAGSLDGDLDITFANLVQSENGIIEPEAAAGDYENGGDLHLFLQIAAFVDVNHDGIFNSGDIQLAYGGQSRAYPGWRDGALYYSGVNSMMPGWNDVMTLAADESVDVVVAYQLPTVSQDANYSQNIAMTDTLRFDVRTSLEQVGGNGGVVE